MLAEIRTTITRIQHTYNKGGRPLAEPSLLIAAMTIVCIPWFGRGFFESLKPEIRDLGPKLNKLLTDMVMAASGNKLKGYGKASVVGFGGEIEHVHALTHTIWFGNQYRDAVEARTYLAFAFLRGAAGCPLVIP